MLVLMFALAIGFIGSIEQKALFKYWIWVRTENALSEHILHVLARSEKLD